MKIGIIGCCGRMGKMIGEMAIKNGHEVVIGSDRGENTGKMLSSVINGAFETKISDNYDDVFKVSEMVIDFTVIDAAIPHAEAAVKYKKPLLIGTTGLKTEQYDKLSELAKETVIVTSANASLGVNILKSFVKKMAELLDDSYDIEIVEMHHRNKVDSPSGTALIFGKSAAEGRKINFEENAIKERNGIIGKRETGKIGFASLRGGDVIGDHTVIFAGNGERIELTHKATSRELFVTGVMKIIKWASKGVKPGKLYGMDDVLGL